MHARGESCSSLSSGPPLSNSTSQCRFTAFLERFAGGVEAEGESAADGASGKGGAGDGGGARFNGRGSLGVFPATGAAYWRSLLQGWSCRDAVTDGDGGV
jgi:hypothetical protein